MSVWNRHILTQKRQMPGFYKFFKVSPTFFTFIKMYVYPCRRLAVCVIYCDTLFFCHWASIHPSWEHRRCRELYVGFLSGWILGGSVPFPRLCCTAVTHSCLTEPVIMLLVTPMPFLHFPIHSKLRLLEKRLLVIDYFQKRAWNAAEYLCLWSCKM